MSESPFYAPDHRAPERQPAPGEHVWTLTKGTSTMRGEVRSHGTLGVEFQAFGDGGLIYGRWHPSREIALKEAEDYRQQFVRDDGWRDAE